MKSSIQLLAALFLGSIAGTAMALPMIEGQIDLVKLGNTVNVDTVSNTVVFTVNGAGQNASVNDLTGDYATVASVGMTATYSTFVYDPFVGPQTIWTSSFGSFTLHTLQVDLEKANLGVFLSGEGIAKLNGFADTWGSWSFSADRSNANARFNFSSTNTSSSVPDGGATVILFGAALAGMSFLARRRLMA